MSAYEAPMEALARYYAYLYEVAQGHLRDPAQQQEHLQIVKGWQTDVERLGKKFWFGEREER